MLKIEMMTVSPTFRDWLASEEATQQLVEAKAENEATADRCAGCDLPLTDSVERYDLERRFSGWGMPPLCNDCGREWAGED